MKKNPWYPMYASDWNNDTAEWPLEADGALIRLMNHQAINGSLPSDMPSLARICRVHTKVIERLYRVYLSHKFDSDGVRIVNKRLSLVLKEQAEKQLSLSERGKRGADKRWPGHTPKDSISESESESEDLSKDKSISQLLKLTEVIDCDIADRMANTVRHFTNGFPDFVKKPRLRLTWINDARLLRTRDKRDPVTTIKIIEALERGEFDNDSFKWSNNIQSIGKLRRKNKDGKTYWEVLHELYQRKNASDRHHSGPSKFDRLRAGQRSGAKRESEKTVS